MSVTASKCSGKEEYNLHKQTGNRICLNMGLLISKAPPDAWNMLMKLIYCDVNLLFYLQNYVETLYNIYLSVELCCQALIIVAVKISLIPKIWLECSDNAGNFIAKMYYSSVEFLLMIELKYLKWSGPFLTNIQLSHSCSWFLHSSLCNWQVWI